MIKFDPNRTYQFREKKNALGSYIVGGRETTGYVKGERILCSTDVKVGDLLIDDSHQFQATNLLIVVPLPESFQKPEYPEEKFYAYIDCPEMKFYACYADVDGNNLGTLRVVWKFELTGNFSSYYHAIKNDSKTH